MGTVEHLCKKCLKVTPHEIDGDVAVCWYCLTKAPIEEVEDDFKTSTEDLAVGEACHPEFVGEN